jgi:chromosome segregation ATPase
MRVHQIAALFGVAVLGFVASAQADDSPPTKTDKAKAEVNEQRKELADKIKENRAELKEKRDELKQELKAKTDELQKEVSDEKRDLKDALAKLRETRADRQKADRQAIRDKYGDIVQQPAAKEELRTHASRIARLNQIKRLADDEKKTKISARADKLIERENKRHEKQMDALKAGKPTTAAADPTKTGTDTANQPASAKGDVK